MTPWDVRRAESIEALAVRVDRSTPSGLARWDYLRTLARALRRGAWD